MFYLHRPMFCVSLYLHCAYLESHGMEIKHIWIKEKQSLKRIIELFETKIMQS